MTTTDQNLSRAGIVRLHRIAHVAFLISAGVWLGAILRVTGLQNARWPEALFLVMALATTLVGLARTLPVQNVVTAALLVGGIASLVELISAKSGIPFGRRTFTDDFGPQWFGLLPWPVPLIWVVVMLNSRGVARLILRPWRKVGKYGFWVIGLTCLLAVIFEFSLEPHASGTNRWWIWQMSRALPAWYSAPCTVFLGWLLTGLLILAFTTPWLINKRPGRSAPPDYHPLVIWLIINLLPAAGSAVQHLWWAVGAGVIAATVVTVFALRGARW